MRLAYILRYAQDKKITKLRLYVNSILSLALPILLVCFTGTNSFETLVTFIVGHTWWSWLSIFAIGALTIYELRLLVTLAQCIIAKGNVEKVNTIRCHPRRMLRIRYYKFALCTVCLTLLSSFCMLEVIFRVYHITPVEGKFRKAPNQFRLDKAVNSRGMREPWEAISADDSRRRIAILGDSFVYGYAVEREQTFTSLLENMLPHTITINMGVCGSNPKGQYATFMKLKDETRPEILLQVIYMNDLDFHLGNLLANIHRIPRRDSWAASRSYVFRYLEKTWQSHRAYTKSIDYFSGGESSAERKKSWADFKTYVSLTKAAVEDIGAKYLMVIFPWLYELDDYPLKHVHAKMHEFAYKLDAPFLDLLDTFEGMQDIDLRVDYMDGHPNPTAHRIAANALRTFILKQLTPVPVKQQRQMTDTSSD